MVVHFPVPRYGYLKRGWKSAIIVYLESKVGGKNLFPMEARGSRGGALYDGQHRRLSSKPQTVTPLNTKKKLFSPAN